MKQTSKKEKKKERKKSKMNIEDSADSDNELVIDETIVVSSDNEEEPEGRGRKTAECGISSIVNRRGGVDESDGRSRRNILLESEKSSQISNSSQDSNGWDCKSEKSIFHLESFSSADMKDELFTEETNTCAICNESFKYNVGLICHMEMEHATEVAELAVPKKSLKRSSKGKKTERSRRKLSNSMVTTTTETETETVAVPVNSNRLHFTEEVVLIKGRADAGNNENAKIVVVRGGGGDSAAMKKSCDVCKKSFSNFAKMSKHAETCTKIGLKFHCIYCKSKFGWESKYKKHLFRTHKLNAAVICRLCSAVFSDMNGLATHTKKCENNRISPIPSQ